MNYIISSVILPGLGPVCPECFSRGYVGPLLLGPREVYSFGVSEPQAQLDWDIDAARALIAARPRTAQRLDPGWLRRWLTERTQFTLEHLMHIPAEKVAEPGILVEIVESPPGRKPDPFRILIDGTHRCPQAASGPGLLGFLAHRAGATRHLHLSARGPHRRVSDNRGSRHLRPACGHPPQRSTRV